MKVGDLVKHRTCGVGIVVCDDTVKNDGDYLVLFGNQRIKTRRSWLEVISEGR